MFNLLEQPIYEMYPGQSNGLISSVVSRALSPHVLYQHRLWSGLDISKTALFAQAAYIAAENADYEHGEWVTLLYKIITEKRLTSWELTVKVNERTAIVSLFKLCMIYHNPTLFERLLTISLNTFTSYPERMQMFADIVQFIGSNSFEYQFSVDQICWLGLEVRDRLMKHKGPYPELLNLLHKKLDQELMILFIEYLQIDNLFELVKKTVLNSSESIDVLTRNEAVWLALKYARFDVACFLFEMGVKFRLSDMPSTLEFIFESACVQKLMFTKWNSASQHALIRLFGLAAQEKWSREWFGGGSLHRIDTALTKNANEDGDFHIAHVLYNVLRSGAGNPAKFEKSVWTALCNKLEKVYGVDRLTMPIKPIPPAIQLPAMELADWKRYCMQSKFNSNAPDADGRGKSTEMKPLG